VTRAAIERRLAEIEGQIAELRPPASGAVPEWLPWVTDRELDELEELFRRWEQHDSPPSDSERLRVIAIEANALARMAAGEPAESE
jgi:hypothetical protein